MPAPLISKNEVISRLTDVFRNQGYDGATLAKLSEATGLKKASLYHYFPNGKRDMARAVLTRLSEKLAAEVLDPLRDGEGRASALNELAENLIAFYLDGRASCLMEVFSLGTARALFQEEIRASLTHLRNALAKALTGLDVDEAEAASRARAAVIVIQGALVVSRSLGDRREFIDAIHRLPAQLLKPNPDKGTG